MFLRSRRRGFTLLELIIVIIVIGILASIALPRYLRVAEKGRAGEAKNMLSALRSSQLRYAAQYSTFSRSGDTSCATTNTLDMVTSQKYFNFTNNCLPVGADVNTPGACVANATRNSTFENPGFGSYWVSIDMSGFINTSSTGLI